MQFGTQVTHPAAPLARPDALALWDAGLPHDPARTRAQIAALEAALAQHPDAVFGDSDVCPLTHRFAPGLYVREIVLPKGFVLTGKIHRHAHPYFLLRGEVLVVTEHGGREHLRAPLAAIAPPGTKRAIVVLAETVWVTVHANPDNTQDLQVLEDQLIAPDYEALAQAAPAEEAL